MIPAWTLFLDPAAMGRPGMPAGMFGGPHGSSPAAAYAGGPAAAYGGGPGGYGGAPGGYGGGYGGGMSSGPRPTKAQVRAATQAGMPCAAQLSHCKIVLCCGLSGRLLLAGQTLACSLAASLLEPSPGAQSPAACWHSPA